MAEPTNFTQYLTEKMIRDLYCSKRFTAGQVHNELIFLSVLNTLLATSAFLGNTLILVALRKESSLHPPFKLMYCNLAITDLCVGIIAEPLCVVYFMSVVNETWDVCLNTHLILAITGTILCAESLVTVAAISVDRLLALSLGLRYRQVITLKRAYTAVIVMWVLSIVCTSSYFWNPPIYQYSAHITIALCLLISVFSYTKIIFTLRHNQIHTMLQGHNCGQGPPSQSLIIAKYRKAVYSGLWVQGTLFICYLPHGIAVALTPQRGMDISLYLVRQFTLTLVYFNSSLNPFLYCWKAREVRRAVRRTLRQLFCSSS